MGLHKVVANMDGGRKVDLTPEEELACIEERAKNKKLKVEKVNEINRKKSVRSAAREKLLASLDLSDEEKELMFG